MHDTMYLPRSEFIPRIAPTELDPLRKVMMRGIVHDENARETGGVSGHAGLFSTAYDLALFGQMILNGGTLHGRRVLREKTIQMMMQPQLQAESLNHGSTFLRERKQLLGWWGMDERMTITNIGGLPSRTAFGHSGFTGTLIYLDPEHNLLAILLSNAVHPNRESANRSLLYHSFFDNLSRALVGEEVNIKPQQMPADGS